MRAERAAYAAFAWAVVFAGMSFYWAAGGTAGIETIGGEIERQTREREPDFVATLWVTAALKLVAAAVALGLVQPWGARLGRVLVPLAGIGGALLVLYEGAELVQHLLMATGAIGRGGLDDTAVYGHLLFWDPWWILGGALFALAAWEVRRSGTGLGRGRDADAAARAHRRADDDLAGSQAVERGRDRAEAVAHLDRLAVEGEAV